MSRGAINRGAPLPPAHGGDVRSAAARWGVPPEQIIDFSASINPLGTPLSVLEAVQRALPWVRHYPELHARTVAGAIAAARGVPAASVLVGNGAAEVIDLVARLARGRRALIPSPSFGEYARAVWAAGGEVIHWPLANPDGGTDVAALDRAAEQAGAALIFLGNPNNPTGSLMPADQVLWLGERAARRGALLVVDEAFIDFTDRPEESSVAVFAAGRPGLFAIGSLTKFYALPGIRVGYGMAPPDVVAEMEAQRDPWSVGALAQAAALAALADHDYARRTRDWLQAERPRFLQELATLPGLRPWPAAANFVLVDGRGTGLSAWELQEALGPRGLLLRDCRSFGLHPGFFRLAIRTAAENDQLIAALRQVPA